MYPTLEQYQLFKITQIRNNSFSIWNAYCRKAKENYDNRKESR